MKLKIKFIYIVIFLFFFNKLYSYEVIRDPIFENYFYNISNDLGLKEVNVYLVSNKIANAFVINNNIYFTTGLLEVINNEDTLKAIFLHEYGHIIKNHFESKKIKIQQSSSKNTFYGLFSVGLAIITGSSDIGIGANITLNTNLVKNISKHSINFEIEADNFMLKQIDKNEINVKELISFLSKVENSENNYFRTHPRSKERINNLRKLNYNESNNSTMFNWIKSKYSFNSNFETFNIFFKNLEKGIFNQEKKINKINKYIVQYEAFKKGIFINDWDINFQKLLTLNNNSFLKLEYINYLLDHNLKDKYYFIENLKFNNELKDEYFYYYIYGKYYNKVDEINLSNFYFCQFYKAINSNNKSDFFCKKYDIKDIPMLDRSYALFK